MTIIIRSKANILFAMELIKSIYLMKIQTSNSLQLRSFSEMKLRKVLLNIKKTKPIHGIISLRFFPLWNS